jgi:RimJ/RimL family protein N-acetyltransferase
MAVSISPYQLSDVDTIYDAVMESVHELQPFMPWCHSDMTRDQQRTWVETQVANFQAGTAFEFTIVGSDNGCLGCCGINQIDTANKRANVAYWVRSTQTKHGVATTAVGQLAQWAFTNTDLIRLEILVSIQNAASLRVAERVGAVREGILRNRLLLHGRMHDAAMFSLLRN